MEITISICVYGFRVWSSGFRRAKPNFIILVATKSGAWASKTLCLEENLEIREHLTEVLG